MESLEADDPSFPYFPGFPWKLCSELPSFPRKSLDTIDQNLHFYEIQDFLDFLKYIQEILGFFLLFRAFENPWLLAFLRNFPRKIQIFLRNFQAFFIRDSGQVFHSRGMEESSHHDFVLLHPEKIGKQ